MVYRWHFHLDLTILQSEIVILIMLDQCLIVVGDIYKIVTPLEHLILPHMTQYQVT